MNKHQLAQNLAASLTARHWSEQTLQTTLERRLPSTMRKHASALSAEIFAACPMAYAPSIDRAASEISNAYSFARIYRYCRRYDIWPAPDVTEPLMAPIAAFSDLPLPQLPTLAALATWLALPLERLNYYADPTSRHETHGETAVNHYHYYLLPKAAGGVRLIEAPKQRLKAFQRMILRGILDIVPVHSNAFGFIRGRNCLDAAARHAGEDIVICLDVRNFFPTISAGRVFGLFRCLGYPHAVAAALTGLCTNRTPVHILARMAKPDRRTYNVIHLPQGAPTSPALANLASYTLDVRLSALARSVGAQYSRYADDLTFSGDKHIGGILARLTTEIMRDEGFQPNPQKTRFMSAKSRQTVTGVVVNRHLNVPRERFDHIKAVIHACGKPHDDRWLDPAFRAKLLGEIGWVELVNPPRGLKLRHLLAKAVAARTNSLET